MSKAIAELNRLHRHESYYHPQRKCNIEMLETLATPEGCFAIGDIVHCDQNTATQWVNSKIAIEVLDLTEEQRVFEQHCRQGGGCDCIYVAEPFMEFGHECLHRIPFIYHHLATTKYVYCKPGDEVLYPNADQHILEWPTAPDHEIVGSGRFQLEYDELLDYCGPKGVHLIQTGNLSLWQELNCSIKPEIIIPFNPKKRGLKTDLLLGIRNRDFCNQKNWPHWQKVADALRAEGFTVAVAGKRPTTADVKGQLFNTADFPDTDATIEALQNCRLYISTDTGTSHLAALCQTKSLIFREEGHGFRNFLPRMLERNKNMVAIKGCWRDYKKVIAHALHILNDTDTSRQIQ